MLFSSPIFLFLFLPFTLLIYYLAPKRAKNLILLVLSLGFYTWGEKELVVLIILSALIDYLAGLIILSGKRKLGLILSLFFNLSILVYFKYSNFVFSNLVEILQNFNITTTSANRFANVVLPLGISFYTFQTMSYTIDVYRGSVKANKNFIHFATYVTLFPQLIAGPIVRYSHIEKELKNRTTSFPLFAEGVERFIIGLAKKMIIANNCAFLVDGIFNLPANEASVIITWLGVIAYSFQIYFDFSGYSDMAIGLGKMFGFNFPENFNYPYISKSIQEFWRRWHITLSSWFKDYLYISLGGNRKGTLRTYLNLFIVFFITGLWHGASWTYIIWGISHGLFIVIEKLGLKKLLNKAGKGLSVFYTLLAVNITWPIFRSDTITDAFNYIKMMFNFNATTNFEYLNYYLSKETIIVLILALIFSTPVHRKFKEYIKSLNRESIKYKVLISLKIIGLFSLLFISYIYIATDSYNPFIYFRF
ncbi:MBOAT family O-acyltransferase [Lacinutrix sp.]|uniref:MBOAT family O-acyltransferase n=1 Tax=Lacinutrix sp. TaxID=1937692 RepID=UPI0025C0AF61|nr:MBOAT family O-acyltransferase [Lacinutrix sp.]